MLPFLTFFSRFLQPGCGPDLLCWFPGCGQMYSHELLDGMCVGDVSASLLEHGEPGLDGERLKANAVTRYR